MLSYICLSLFIILVYVSGSKLNNIEISSQFLNKDIRKTFNNTTITQQSSSVTIEKLSAVTITTTSSSASVSTIPTNILVKKDHDSLHMSKLSSSLSVSTTSKLFLPSSSSSSSSTPSTVVVASTLSSIESPSTYFPLPIELTTKTTTKATTTATTTTHTTKGAHTISNVGYLNITSQAGTHVYLPCNVKQLVDRPISWIRVRDGHILTVDQTTFIADERFQSVYTDNPERWALLIKYVQTKDSGSYECQVSTEPKMSSRIQLNVLEPKTELLGESIRHVKAGSRVILRCIVSGGLEPPLYINWYFNKRQIILNNRNSWTIELNNQSMTNGNSTNYNDLKPNTIASLIIPSVTKKDSGNYTCSPSNSESITIVLHVLNGEYSASAITSGCNNIFHRHLHHHQQHYHYYHHPILLLLLFHRYHHVFYYYDNNKLQSNLIKILCFFLISNFLH